MSRMYDQGSTSQSRQLARREVKIALTSLPSSLPTKSQFFRPTAFAAQRELAHVVVDGQAAIFEEPRETLGRPIVVRGKCAVEAQHRVPGRKDEWQRFKEDRLLTETMIID